MRHVFSPGTVPASACGMMKAAATTVLIAVLRLSLLDTSRLLGTTAMAIPLPAVAVATQVNLATASRAQEEASTRFHLSPDTNRERWTPFPHDDTLSHGYGGCGTASVLSAKSESKLRLLSRKTRVSIASCSRCHTSSRVDHSRICGVSSPHADITVPLTYLPCA